MDLAPGDTIRLPAEPDWGDGHVQSVDGRRVTVNFTERGKVTLNLEFATVQLVRAAEG